MGTFGSFHLIINNKPYNDCYRHAHEFKDIDSFCGEVLLLHFFKWTPSTNANISSRHHAHLGKTLHMSSAKISNLRGVLAVRSALCQYCALKVKYILNVGGSK